MDTSDKDRKKAFMSKREKNILKKICEAVPDGWRITVFFFLDMKIP